jgi:hypothetical protein
MSPCIVALVGETRQELAYQTVLAGVDLDTVQVGLDGQLRRIGESVDDRSDVVGFHPLRYLARIHLGHPRRCPQRSLGICGRPLPAGVVERGDHQRAVRSAGPHDRSPAVAAPFGQRCALVRPVRRVDGGTLHHDRPAPTASAPLVVGDEPFGDRPIIAPEVRDVWPEHDPVRCRARTDGDGRQQLHAVSILAGTINSGRASVLPAESTGRCCRRASRGSVRTDRPRRRTPTPASPARPKPTGTSATAITEPSAALPVTLDTSHHSPTASGARIGCTISSTPDPVATPLPPFEAAQHREHVPHDRGGAAPVRHRPSIEGQPESGGEPTFAGVEHVHPYALAPAERAGDVRRSRVAGAERRDVDAVRSRDQDRRRERAQEVGDRHEEEHGSGSCHHPPSKFRSSLVDAGGGATDRVVVVASHPGGQRRPRVTGTRTGVATRTGLE